MRLHSDFWVLTVSKKAKACAHERQSVLPGYLSSPSRTAYAHTRYQVCHNYVKHEFSIASRESDDSNITPSALPQLNECLSNQTFLVEDLLRALYSVEMKAENKEH